MIDVLSGIQTQTTKHHILTSTNSNACKICNCLYRTYTCVGLSVWLGLSRSEGKTKIKLSGVQSTEQNIWTREIRVKTKRTQKGAAYTTSCIHNTYERPNGNHDKSVMRCPYRETNKLHVWVRERTIPTERPRRRSDCQLLRIKGATWSAWRIPTTVFSVF
jgi:hypothetical protein